MTLLRQRVDHVEVLTLDRPDVANSLNPDLLAALDRAAVECAADPDVRAVVVAASGTRIFCAGMDLAAFARGEAPHEATEEERAVSILGGRFPKPLVAAVNGAAVGGGFELVLACDLVVAAEQARFGLPEVRRGLYPAGGGTMLSTRVPLALAMELALTGDLVSAEVARSMGVVNRVTAAEELHATALALAGRVAANGPLGVQLTKRLLRAAVAQGPAAGMATPAEQAAIFASADASEGSQAFLEKRDPVWTGR